MESVTWEVQVGMSGAWCGGKGCWEPDLMGGQESLQLEGSLWALHTAKREPLRGGVQGATPLPLGRAFRFLGVGVRCGKGAERQAGGA